MTAFGSHYLRFQVVKQYRGLYLQRRAVVRTGASKPEEHSGSPESLFTTREDVDAEMESPWLPGFPETQGRKETGAQQLAIRAPVNAI